MTEIDPSEFAEVLGRVSDLESGLESIEANLNAIRLGVNDAYVALTEKVASHEPWVGPEGQLRFRLERMEQAVLAIIADPGNPHSAAERARDILNLIMPVTQPAEPGA